MNRISGKNSIPSFMRVIVRMVGISAKTAPVSFGLYLVTSLIFTVLLIANIHLIRELLDGLPLFADGKIAYREILLTVLLLGGVNIINNIMNGTMNLLYEYSFKKTSGRMAEDMNEKAQKVDLIHFESTELFNRIEKAVSGRERGFDAMAKVAFSIIFHGGYFFFLSLYFATIKPELILAVTASFIPVAISRYIRASAFYKTESRTAPLRREFKHYEECLTDRRYFKETRTLRANSFFRNLYEKTLMTYNKEMWRTEVRTGIIDLGLKLLTLLGYVGLLLLLLHYLLHGEISPGIFGAVYFTMNHFFKWFEEAFNRLGSAYQDAAIGGNYFHFMDLPERKGEDVNISHNEGIFLENVSFRYPGKDEKVVDLISLKIKAGETLAIVGENGAGKTTLVKLISGMLLPDEGTVRVGDTETGKASPVLLFRGISAVFQNYQRYRMTLRDNVAISSTENPSSDKAINKALTQAEFHIENQNISDGLNTVLSREFGGTDLSGGEWQRVAIARGLFRDHDLVILDEPTAAIDPIEESRVYRKFIEAARGKTAIIVTHRLGSTQNADRIVVMDKGKIIEKGTHKALLQMKGKYSEMFQAQARWYDRD